MANDQAYNIFGLVAGAIGILAAIPISVIFSNLPRSHIRPLETLLRETEASLRSAVAEGLIPDDNVVKHLHDKLFKAKEIFDVVRYQVYDIHTIRQDLRQWKNGLSNAMTSLRCDLQKIRVEISKRTSAERELRREECCEASLKHLSAYKDLATKYPEKPSSGMVPPSYPQSVFTLADTENAVLPTPTMRRIREDEKNDAQDKAPSDSRPPSRGRSRRDRIEKRRSVHEVLVRLGQELASGHSHGIGAVESATYPSQPSQPRVTPEPPTSCKKGSSFGKALRSLRRTLSPRAAIGTGTSSLPRSHSCCDGPLLIQFIPEVLSALEVSDESDYSEDDDDGDEDSCDLGTTALPV